MIVEVDIPYKVLKEAVERIEKKIGICDKLPSGRFIVHQDPYFGPPNEWRVSEITCDQMGGKSTGTVADTCKNCLKEKMK